MSAPVALLAVFAAVAFFFGGLWLMSGDDEIKLYTPRSPEDTLLEGLRVRYLQGAISLDEFEHHIERALRDDHDRHYYERAGGYFACLASINEVREAIGGLPPAPHPAEGVAR